LHLVGCNLELKHASSKSECDKLWGIFFLNREFHEIRSVATRFSTQFYSSAVLTSNFIYEYACRNIYHYDNPAIASFAPPGESNSQPQAHSSLRLILIYIYIYIYIYIKYIYNIYIILPYVPTYSGLEQNFREHCYVHIWAKFPLSPWRLFLSNHSPWRIKITNTLIMHFPYFLRFLLPCLYYVKIFSLAVHWQTSFLPYSERERDQISHPYKTSVTLTL